MIAATDPQEFIPRGRQHVLNHPGPYDNMPQKFHDTPLVDKDLLIDLEKVNIVDDVSTEWWMVREASNVFYLDDSSIDQKKSSQNQNQTTLGSFVSMESWHTKCDIHGKTKRKSGLLESGTSKNESQNNFHRDISNILKLPEFKVCKQVLGYTEDELYVKGKTAVWTQGLSYNESDDQIYKTVCSYSTNLPIKQALWCNFFKERPLIDKSEDVTVTKVLPSVCIVEKQSLRVFMDNEDFLAATPLVIKHVWPTMFGVILENEIDAKSQYNTSQHQSQVDVKSTDCEGNRGKMDSTNFGIFKEFRLNLESRIEEPFQPTMFFLGHPLDVFSAVVFKYENEFKIIENSDISIVFTSDHPSLCVTYDSKTGRHSIYHIRKLAAIELLEFRHNKNYQLKSLIQNPKSTDHLKTFNRVSEPLLPSQIAGHSTEMLISQVNLRPPSVNCFNCIRLESAPSSISAPWVKRSSRLNSSIYTANSNIARQETRVGYKNSKIYHDPIICLEHLWTDTQHYTHEDPSLAAASKVFISYDFIGQLHLYYFVLSKSQLSIIRIETGNKHVPSFQLSRNMRVKDVVSVPGLHIVAVLEGTGDFVLYTGQVIVGKVHIGGTLAQHFLSSEVMPHLKQFHSPFPRRSSLSIKNKTPRKSELFHTEFSPVLPVTTNLIHLPFKQESDKRTESPFMKELKGLQDAVNNRLTLQYSDGTQYRITLPPICTSNLVESCINALKQTLPKESAIAVLVKWYSARNSLGSKNSSAEEEWNIFTQTLLKLIGFENESNEKLHVVKVNDAKRQKQSNLSTDNDWNYVLESEPELNIFSDVFGFKNCEMSLKSTPKSFRFHKNTNSLLFSSIRVIHFTFHLLYEDLKLNLLRYNELPLLASFLSHLAMFLNLVQYQVFYWKDFPELCLFPDEVNEHYFSQEDYKMIILWSCMSEKPYSVFQFLENLINDKSTTDFPYIPQVNERTNQIIQLWSAYHELDEDKFKIPTGLVKINVPFGTKGSRVIITLPNSLNNTPGQRVVEMLTQMEIQASDLETYPVGVHLLLIDAIWSCREQPPNNWPVEAYNYLHRQDLVNQMQVIKKEIIDKDKSAFDKYMSKSSARELHQTVAQIESKVDDGMADIDNALLKLRFPNDLRAVEARRLLQSSQPVTISITQRPDVSDHDFIEEQEKHLFAMCTRTMALPVGRGMFTLCTASPVPTETLVIPTLCLVGKAPPRGTTVELSHIDISPAMNNWPLFHNGVANGLRINPNSPNIDSSWITFNKPKGNNEIEHAGFLMALGLNGFLQNLSVYRVYEYLNKEQEMTNIGILIGLSATHRGTADNAVSRLLSIFVESLLPPTSVELEYTQNEQIAALLSIGLVYEQTSHRYMTECLLTEIGRPPGPEMENSVDRQSYSLAASLALGMVTLGQGDKPSALSDLKIPDMLHYYMVGGNKKQPTGSQKEKYKVTSFQVKEGSSVNLDVTAPGATLALGLMYLNTGNKSVADWMSPPTTQYLLDFVRPDLLMLRTLSRALIMWNDIQPTKKWVEGHVPSTILMHCLVTPSQYSNIDYEAMNKAYCNIVAGACFSLGLRFAGSNNINAFNVLLYFCRMFITLAGKSISELAGKPTIEVCMNVILISASMVVAGTGNIEIMRIIRHLRKRVGVSANTIITYGSHLATHMSLGLLFLGGGRYTLSNSPKSIAALICAFYPKFPTHSNDNRYHLQAFRHLYVLAVQPRLLIPKDAMSGRICYANICVVDLKGTSLNIKCPDLIPDLMTLYKVCVNDERYWPVVFERGKNWDLLENILKTHGLIEIKQRVGYINYDDDKNGYLMKFAHTLNDSCIVPWNPPAKVITSFSSNKSVRNFCETFLKDIPASEFEMKFKQILTNIIYDCVVHDKLNVFPIVTSLIKAVEDLKHSSNIQQLWQFKLVRSQVRNKSLSQQLVTNEVITALEQKFDNIFNIQLGNIQQNVISYLLGKTVSHFNNVRRQLASYVSFYDIPYNCITSYNDPINLMQHLQHTNVNVETICKIINILSTL